MNTLTIQVQNNWRPYTAPISTFTTPYNQPEVLYKPTIPKLEEFSFDSDAAVLEYLSQHASIPCNNSNYGVGRDGHDDRLLGLSKGLIWSAAAELGITPATLRKRLMSSKELITLERQAKISPIIKRITDSGYTLPDGVLVRLGKGRSLLLAWRVYLGLSATIVQSKLRTQYACRNPLPYDYLDYEQGWECVDDHVRIRVAKVFGIAPEQLVMGLC